MCPDNNQGPQPSIERQAATWFALLCDPGASDEQHRACQQWQQQDPRHAAAYARLETLWEASATLPVASLQAPARPTISRRQLLGWASAACVVAGSSTLGWHLHQQRGDIRTLVGESRQLTLADGSRLELAGDSALNIDFSEGRRALKLLSGEIYLEASNASQPLLVSAGSGLCQLNGSHTAICHENSGVSVSAIQGRTRIILGSHSSELQTGQRQHYQGQQPGPITEFDADLVLAWRDGRLVFFDTPLATVIEHLQRWQPSTILISNRQLANRPVSLILDLERREQALELLANNLPIQIRRFGPLTLLQPLA